jgi:hypothetical protein
MIKKVKGGYQVVSSKERNRDGSHKTLRFAKRRLRQVEFSTTAKGKSGEDPAGMEVRMGAVITVASDVRHRNSADSERA